MNDTAIFRRRIGAAIALALVSTTMLAASCGGEGDDAGSREHVPAPGAQPANAPRGTVPDDGGISRESQVLHLLITANAEEIQHGKIAEEKATSDDVRAFATAMVEDHGAANDRITALAQQMAITPEPSSISEDYQEDSDFVEKRLEARTGAAFDKVYIESEIISHVKLMAMMDKVLLPTAVDRELKQALEEMRATIMAHIGRAKDIRRGMVGIDSGIMVSTDASTHVDASIGGEEDAGGNPEGGVLLRDSGMGFDAARPLAPPGPGFP